MTTEQDQDYLGRVDELLAERIELGAIGAPASIFKDLDDDFWLWMHTTGRSLSPALYDLLPELPDPDLQRHWVGKSGTEALTEGFEIYRTFRDVHQKHFGPVRDNGPILDFGCGFGRVLRFFAKDVNEGDLLGSDADEELVEICQRNDRWSRVTRNDEWPPTGFEDGQVGFIYAYSVFSHFSEELHRAWLEEFKRILRPGGALALTIRRRRFIVYCGSQQGDPDAPITSRMFPDTAAELARYDRGEFCFTPYVENGRWGEACIPRAYVESRWSDLFDVVEFAGTNLRQDVVLLRG